MNFENTITDLLGRGIPVRFRATGDSMDPTIRCGEYLHVVPVEASAVSRGDVVLARHQRGLTAHRVIRIDGGRVITRGDNCSVDDPTFTVEQLLGRIAVGERDGHTRNIPKFSRARGWVRRALTHFSRRRQRLSARVRVVWQSVL